MRCQFCGKRIALRRVLVDRDFCSDAHRREHGLRWAQAAAEQLRSLDLDGAQVRDSGLGEPARHGVAAKEGPARQSRPARGLGRSHPLPSQLATQEPASAPRELDSPPSTGSPGGPTEPQSSQPCHPPCDFLREVRIAGPPPREPWSLPNFEVPAGYAWPGTELAIWRAPRAVRGHPGTVFTQALLCPPAAKPVLPVAEQYLPELHRPGFPAWRNNCTLARAKAYLIREGMAPKGPFRALLQEPRGECGRRVEITIPGLSTRLRLIAGLPSEENKESLPSAPETASELDLCGLTAALGRTWWRPQAAGEHWGQLRFAAHGRDVTSEFSGLRLPESSIRYAASIAPGLTASPLVSSCTSPMVSADLLVSADCTPSAVFLARDAQWEHVATVDRSSLGPAIRGLRFRPGLARGALCDSSSGLEGGWAPPSSRPIPTLDWTPGAGATAPATALQQLAFCEGSRARVTDGPWEARAAGQPARWNWLSAGFLPEDSRLIGLEWGEVVESGRSSLPERTDAAPPPHDRPRALDKISEAHERNWRPCLPTVPGATSDPKHAHHLRRAGFSRRGGRSHLEWKRVEATEAEFGGLSIRQICIAGVTAFLEREPASHRRPPLQIRLQPWLHTAQAGAAPPECTGAGAVAMELGSRNVGTSGLPTRPRWPRFRRCGPLVARQLRPAFEEGLSLACSDEPFPGSLPPLDWGFLLLASLPSAVRPPDAATTRTAAQCEADRRASAVGDNPPRVREAVPEGTSGTVRSRLSSVTDWCRSVATLLGGWKHLPRPARLKAAGLAVCVLLGYAGWQNRGRLEIDRRWNGMLQAISERSILQLDEDFSGGLRAWQGRGDWAVSPGGMALPRSLALYAPSLGLSNYRLEFTAVIEKKAVGWTVRAAGPDNYYAIKLAIVKTEPPAEAVLIRYPVIRGTPAKPVQAPSRLHVRLGEQYQVLTDVQGAGIGVFVDGTLVDTWSIDEFPKGGVGFFCERGEQARLLGVSLTDQDDLLGKLCGLIAQHPAMRQVAPEH